MKEAPLYNDMAEGPEGGRAFWLTASDGVRIRAAHWPGGDAGSVLLFPGRTEYIEKYGRTAKTFATHGYGTVAIDWRGQGLADRLSKDRSLGHIGAFTDYQRDVAAVLEMARALDAPRPWFLLAHSMGGCIGLRALHEGLPVAGAMFTAPMWGLSIPPRMRPVAWGLSWLSHRFTAGTSYAPGTDRKTYVLIAPFEDNVLTTDPDNYAYMQRHAREHPELTIAGPSLRWLFEALVETRRLRATSPPDVPALTFLGTNERVVDPRPIRQMMARWPNGELVEVPGSEHEVLIEKPEIRALFFSRATAFMQAHASSAHSTRAKAAG